MSHQSHDEFARKTLSVKQVASEVISLVFGDRVNDLFDLNTLEYAETVYDDDKGKKKIADLMLSLKRTDSDASTRILVLFEHKSYEDPEALLQILEYCTCAMRKYGCPVIPVLIYHGESRHWTGPLELLSSLKHADAKLQRELGAHMPNFVCKLLNVHEIYDSGRTTGMFCDSMMYSLSKIWEVRRGVDHLEIVRKVMVKCLEIDAQWRSRIQGWIIEYFTAQNKGITADVVLEIEQQVISEDKQIMVGILKKREIKGLERGLDRGRQEIIEKMIRDGMEISDIVRITGHTEKEIVDLRNGA